MKTVNPNDSLLLDTLQVAVPLWVQRLRNYNWAHIEKRGKECAQHIAEHGDNILYLSKQPGATADAFNRLAEGIACLSFAPGGVKFMGVHWENEHGSQKSKHNRVER